MTLALATFANASTKEILNLPGDVINVLVDHTKSGRRLGVVYADTQRPLRERYIAWFQKGQGSQGKLIANGKTRLWSDVAGFSYCGKERSLVFLRGPGIYKLNASGAEINQETLFYQYDDFKLPEIPICTSLFDNDGNDFLIPTAKGVAIWKDKTFHHEVKALGRLRFRSRPDSAPFNLHKLAINLENPGVDVIDMNGDSHLDLCFTIRDRLTCHLQNPSTGFKNATVIDHDFRVLQEDERKQSSLYLNSKILDLNRDNLMDVVVTKTSFSLSDMRGEVRLFYQKKPGRFSAKPDKVIAREGYFGFQEFFDYDLDGDIDLIAPVADVGISDMIRVFFSRTLNLEFVNYENSKTGFGSEPVLLFDLSYPIDFKNISSFTGGLPKWQVKISKFFSKEFSRQILLFPNKERIELHGIGGKGSLSEKPLWQLATDIGEIVELVDLDNDGSDEILMLYPRSKDQSHELVYIVS
jgi:hypothetical protein